MGFLSFCQGIPIEKAFHCYSTGFLMDQWKSTCADSNGALERQKNFKEVIPVLLEFQWNTSEQFSTVTGVWMFYTTASGIQINTPFQWNRRQSSGILVTIILRVLSFLHVA